MLGGPQDPVRVRVELHESFPGVPRNPGRGRRGGSPGAQGMRGGTAGRSCRGGALGPERARRAPAPGTGFETSEWHKKDRW